jgi:ubiquinone/menaquinone biosynthesis C-methylase UbiE
MNNNPAILSKQQIEQIFNGAASSYDNIGPGIFREFGEHLLHRIPVSPGMHVLDVATGKGAVLIPMTRRVGSQGKVIGIDLSSVILEEARRLVDVNGFSNVELHKMDAEHLDFADKSFDVVTCAFALFMFPDMNAALREMYRVCKPGGYIAVTYFNKTPPPFDPGWRIFATQSKEYRIGMRMPQQLGLAPEELEGLLISSGFKIVRTDCEIYDLVYKTAEDWWGFMLTLGSRASILSMDDKTRDRFKNEYLNRLISAALQDGLHIATSVIFSVAKR